MSDVSSITSAHTRIIACPAPPCFSKKWEELVHTFQPRDRVVYVCVSEQIKVFRADPPSHPPPTLLSSLSTPSTSCREMRLRRRPPDPLPTHNHNSLLILLWSSLGKTLASIYIQHKQVAILPISTVLPAVSSAAYYGRDGYSGYTAANERLVGANETLSFRYHKTTTKMLANSIGLPLSSSLCRFRYCSGDGVLLHASDSSGQRYLALGMSGVQLLLSLNDGTDSQEVCSYLAS